MNLLLPSAKPHPNSKSLYPEPLLELKLSQKLVDKTEKNRVTPPIDFNNNNASPNDDEDDDYDDEQINSVASSLDSDLTLTETGACTPKTEAVGHGKEEAEEEEEANAFFNFSSYLNKGLSEKQARDLFYKEYALGRQIGEGGFGIIFAAVRRKDQRPVAVKVVKKAKVSQWYDLKKKRSVGVESDSHQADKGI